MENTQSVAQRGRMMTVSSSRSLPAPPLAMAGVLMLLLLFVFCQPVSAWEQDTHMGINLEAIKRFQTIYGTQASFQDSPLLQEALYRGIEVPDSAKLDRNHRMEEADKTYAGWIVHGGYAADEPNLYASVRHFYDPLAISGNAWLTDQISLHGTWNYATGLSIPEIDAKSWGLRHPDNPYTFARALAYYEKAMSIPEGTEPSGFSGSGLFRSQNQKAGTLEEERKEYLAAAFRALGESMHLLADMTQPSHVRNDSHPVFEPLEQAVSILTVRQIMQENFPVDPASGIVPGEGLQGAGQSADSLFEMTARYTNSHFFSADTIADDKVGIRPKNGEPMYPSPQLSALSHDPSASGSDLDPTVFYATLNGRQVPLARTDLFDRLDKLGMITLQDQSENFNITPSMAKQQAQVLLPIAVAACTELMERFFPTLTLDCVQAESKTEKDAKGRETVSWRLNASMTHLVEQDVEWSAANRVLRYSGPGRLILREQGKSDRMRRVSFKNGILSAYETGGIRSRLAPGTPVLHARKDPGARLERLAAFYEVAEGTEVLMEVEAGGRLFRSRPFVVHLEGGTLLLSHTPENPSENESVVFQTDGEPSLHYFWDFGDGNTQEGTGLTEVSHTYAATGDYAIHVVARNGSNSGVIRGSAEMDLTVQQRIALVFLPGNNLEGPLNEWMDVSVQPADNTMSLSGMTVRWTADGAETAPNGPLLRLRYAEPGQYTIMAEVLNVQGEPVGRSTALVDVETVSTSRLLPENPTIPMETPLTFTVERDGQPVSVGWSLKEETKDASINSAGVFRALVPGTYVVRAATWDSPPLTFETTVRVDKPAGRWVLESVTKKHASEAVGGGDGWPHISGHTSTTDNSYQAEIIIKALTEGNEDQHHLLDMSWDALPTEFEPLDVITIRYRTRFEKLAGGSMHVPLTGSIILDDDRRTGLFSAQCSPDSPSVDSEVQFTVPIHQPAFYQTDMAHAESLEIFIQVSPMQQYFSGASYRYRYVYQE